jgi:hypothetical protein
MEGNYPQTGFVLSVAISDDMDLKLIEDSAERNLTVLDKMDVVTKEGESKWMPSRCTCNGSEMRRIMCLMDKDEQRFKMVDVDLDDYNGEEVGNETSMS